MRNFLSFPICTIFQYISGVAKTSSSAIFPRSTICTISFWYSDKNAPGNSRIATLLYSFASMKDVIKTDSVSTVRDTVAPGTES